MYRVVIPSYQRRETIADKTLKTLIDGGVPPELITVLLHEHDPSVASYNAPVEGVGANIAVTPARSLVEQRNMVGQLMPEGERIVTVDDDLTSIDTLSEDGRKFAPTANVHKLFADMFNAVEQEGLKAWGLSPTDRAQWAKRQLSTNLKFCIFNCVGFINEPNHPAQNLTLTIKDDYQHTLLRWWYDGAMLRNDGAYARSKVYKNPGGLQATDDRRPEEAERAALQLEKEWPGLVRRNRRKTTGFAEISINPKKRHSGHSWDTPIPGHQ